MRITKIALGVSIAIAWLMGVAHSQENWKLGSVKAGADIGLVFDNELIAAVNDAAKGAVVVEHQFVPNEQEMVQQVLRGRLQMGVTSAFAISAALPDMGVLSVPFLWTSDAERIEVTRDHLRPLLEARFEEKGLKLLAIQDSGFNGIFCKFDCSDLSKLKGIKARASTSAVSVALWKALGANPVQLGVADLWPALEQGVVEAGDLVISYYSTTPGVRSAPHFVVTRHLHHPWLYFVNKAAWETLPKETQDAILANLPADYSTAERFAADEAAKYKTFEGMGGIVYQVSDETKKAFADLVVPQMGAVVEGISPGAKEIYDAALSGKAEFAKSN